ncbi:hypothetical protein LZK98_17525 [Sphingomonas cannabina]|uniref:hypothetical protein n=1 Tax=Sphingomonas cannabina TaxID=2899123 RepID=UPI001F315907|nr:hypothetical protein [Sphingomonas cannabina]UIJ47509.1 hypothetical protein LZK98_17525 [Sphingomonas cannabina]
MILSLKLMIRFNKLPARAFVPEEKERLKEGGYRVSNSARLPFKSPKDVLTHSAIMPEVKRMVLASWASDRFAVESQPALRKPPELPHPVPVDDVLAALRQLDRPEEGARVQ